MSVLPYNQILPKKVILHNNEPFLVVSSHIFRKQKNKPQNITKLKSLKSSRVIEITFHQSDKVEEADMETRSVTYLFSKQNEYWFHTDGQASDRFFLTEELIGNKYKFMKEHSDYEAVIFNDEIIDLKFPIKVELKVAEAMDAVKGNTSSGAQKEVTLETGSTLMVPMFINEGDVVSINTDTGEYSERVTKA